MIYASTNYHDLPFEFRTWAKIAAEIIGLETYEIQVRDFVVPGVKRADGTAGMWNPFDPDSDDHFELLRWLRAVVSYYPTQVKIYVSAPTGRRIDFFGTYNVDKGYGREDVCMALVSAAVSLHQAMLEKCKEKDRPTGDCHEQQT